MSFCFPTRQQYTGDKIDTNPSQNFNNPLATDLPAAEFNQCRASASALTQTAFQVYIKYSTVSNGFVYYEPCWDKNRTDMPVVTTTTPGIWRITFPNYVIDVQGNVQITNLLAAQCNPDFFNQVHSFLPPFFFPKQAIVTSNRITNNTFDIYVSDYLSTPTTNVDLLDLFFY